MSSGDLQHSSRRSLNRRIILPLPEGTGHPQRRANGAGAPVPLPVPLKRELLQARDGVRRVHPPSAVDEANERDGDLCTAPTR